MKKGEKIVRQNQKPIRYYMTTFVTVSLLVLIQIFILLYSTFALSNEVIYIDLLCRLISIIVVIYLVNQNQVSSSYKLAWCVPILLFPVFGGLAYLIAKGRQPRKIILKQSRRARDEIEKAKPVLPCNDTPAKNQDPRLLRYLEAKDFPCYDETDLRYFGSGEDMYESMLNDLRTAKTFIFMEFFIVHDGEMLNGILEILRQKVKEGVDVRLLYDGMGSVKCLPMGYDRKLRKEGIQVRVFQPFVPIISTLQNNRDHRKILVIDGTVSYTGGVNISDEYINLYERFGYWKDSGIRLSGKATAGLTKMFLSMWYLQQPYDTDIAKFFPTHFPTALTKNNVVIPYADSPISEENVGQNVYLDIIDNAQNYLYIMTPYFIPGEHILAAIQHAAECGVDVRIITPRIGDKAFIHAVTRSYYDELLRAGVRIYEYTPGFIHSKVFVADDRISTVGTMNLDYRSLYLHYECGTINFSETLAKDIKADFLSTLRKCSEITKEAPIRKSYLMRFFTRLLRVFEPIL